MTCVVHFAAALISSTKLHQPEPTRYEGCHASTEPSGALRIMREVSEGSGEYEHTVARTVALYAPRTWARVTFED